MRPEQDQAPRFRRLQQLFAQAIAQPPVERDAWLQALVGEDAVLRTELQRLLRHDAASEAASTLRADALLQAWSEATPEPLPTRIGRFAIAGELGRGGMGRVLHGVCTRDGVEQHAAIKVLRSDLWDPGAERRLREEARALASLEHPGIARLLEAGRSPEGVAYVAMERVRGEPLLAWCARRGLGLRARVELFRGILAAVAHAHRGLLVHRDLKPANVMVDEDGRPRLLDFGLARFIDREPGERTQTAARFFTPAYASPEQLRGEPITIASDLYALGALLYELLVGTPPFELGGLSAGAAERLLLEASPPAMEAACLARPQSAARLGVGDLRTWSRGLRGDLEAVVQKALRKQPAQRYLSVEAFDADLARWLGRRPVLARQGRLGYRLQRFLQRHAWASALTLCVVLALGAAAHQVWQQGRAAAHARDRAVATLGILNDAFVAADPSQAEGGETSVRRVLEAAAERVRDLRAAQPALHAELAAQISEIRSQLGILVDDGLLDHALEDAGNGRVDAELGLRLALAAAREDVLAQRLEQAGQRIGMLRGRAPDDPRLALIEAQYWLQRQEPDPALERLQPLLASSLAMLTATQQREARWLGARALRQAGRAEEALAVLDALGAAESPGSGASALTRLHRLDVLIELDRHPEAEAELIPLQADLRAHFGQRSALLAHYESSLASLRTAQGRYADAAEAYRRAAIEYADSLGDHHLNAARARFNAAQLRLHLEPLTSEADVDFVAAIDSASRARAPLSPLPMFFRAAFARHLLLRGERERAREVLLPAQGMPLLADFEPGNREDLLELLGLLFGPAACPAAAAADTAPAEQRAQHLLCQASASPPAVPPRSR